MTSATKPNVLDPHLKDVVTFIMAAEEGLLDAEQFHLGVIEHQSVLSNLQGSWQRAVQVVLRNAHKDTRDE